MFLILVLIIKGGAVLCYGTTLNNGQYCPHEIRCGEFAGECNKSRLDICHADHEWCDMCETWHGEDMKCECILDMRCPDYDR